MGDMSDVPVMDRRQLLRRAALDLGLAAISPAVSAAVLNAGGKPAPRRLSPAHLELAGELAKMIIPATDTPDAIAAGVHHFIDATVGQFNDTQQARFLRGLEEVNARASIEASDGFLRADAATRERIVAQLDREAFGSAGGNTFFREFKELALIGYYTSQEGASRELALPAGPGDCRGCVSLMESGGRAWAME